MPTSFFKLETKARVTLSFLLSASCKREILRSFSRRLSNDFSRLVAPFDVNIVKSLELWIRSSLVFLKSANRSSRDCALTVAAVFSVKQSFSFTVQLFSKSWVRFCFASSSAYFLFETQEVKAKLEHISKINIFFIIY